MSATGRLFIAVDPPPPVRAELARWARSAFAPGEPAGVAHRPRRPPRGGSAPTPRRAPSDGIRRVDADALHITVCFLGDQPLDTVDEIADSMHGAVDRLALGGMSIGALGIGAPIWLPPRRPRALAVEIRDGSGGLIALHGELRSRLAEAIAWEPERRRLRPHITVARLRSWAPPPAFPEPSPPLVFQPVALTLYRSRLEPDGARYQGLTRVDLHGTDG